MGLTTPVPPPAPAAGPVPVQRQAVEPEQQGWRRVWTRGTPAIVQRVSIDPAPSRVDVAAPVPDVTAPACPRSTWRRRCPPAPLRCRSPRSSRCRARSCPWLRCPGRRPGSCTLTTSRCRRRSRGRPCRCSGRSGSVETPRPRVHCSRSRCPRSRCPGARCPGARCPGARCPGSGNRAATGSPGRWSRRIRRSSSARRALGAALIRRWDLQPLTRRPSRSRMLDHPPVHRLRPQGCLARRGRSGGGRDGTTAGRRRRRGSSVRCRGCGGRVGPGAGRHR